MNLSHLEKFCCAVLCFLTLNFFFLLVTNLEQLFHMYVHVSVDTFLFECYERNNVNNNCNKVRFLKKVFLYCEK